MTHSHTDLKRHGALCIAALQSDLKDGWNKTKKVKNFVKIWLPALEEVLDLDLKTVSVIFPAGLCFWLVSH